MGMCTGEAGSALHPLLLLSFQFAGVTPPTHFVRFQPMMYVCSSTALQEGGKKTMTSELIDSSLVQCKHLYFMARCEEAVQVIVAQQLKTRQCCPWQKDWN